AERVGEDDVRHGLAVRRPGGWWKDGRSCALALRTAQRGAAAHGKSRMKMPVDRRADLQHAAEDAVAVPAGERVRGGGRTLRLITGDRSRQAALAAERQAPGEMEVNHPEHRPARASERW